MQLDLPLQLLMPLQLELTLQLFAKFSGVAAPLPWEAQPVKAIKATPTAEARKTPTLEEEVLIFYSLVVY